MNQNTSINVTECRAAYVVWVNTDLTEGRGKEVPTAVCFRASTAARLAKGADVMGSNARVSEEVMFLISGRWYAPCNIVEPNAEDRKAETKNVMFSAAKERALKAGLSEEDIKLLAASKI